MKKVILAASLLATTLTFNSCGTTGNDLGSALLQSALGGGNNTTAQAVNAGTSILGNLLSGVLSGTSVSEKDLVGTWTYSGTDCVFESENLLAQAGGMAMAATLENKIDANLQKFGFKKGDTAFTFKADKTFDAKLNGKTFSGTYALDTKNKVISLNAVGGLMQLQPHVARNADGISLLFKADKLLGLVNTTSAFLGQSSSQLSALNGIMQNYKGMRVGLKLRK